MQSLLAFALGCSYWLLAMAAAWQIFLFVQQEEREKLNRTTELFFFLHIVVLVKMQSKATDGLPRFEAKPA